MRFFSLLGRAVGWVVNGANMVSSAFVLILMVLVVSDISGRYLISKPVPMTYEVGAFLLVFIVFFGMAYTQRAGAHIRVEFVTLRLSRRARLILDIVAYILGIGLYGLIVFEGVKLSWTSWEVKEYVAGLVNIPKYPSQFAVPLGASILCLQFISDVVRRIRELRELRRAAQD